LSWIAAVLYPLYLLFGMLAQLAAGAFEPGAVLSIAKPKRWGIGEDRGVNLDIQEIHKHTAINTVIRS